MGQKMVCFGSLRLTRSRQDESIEVGEVGSKRPSLGCNGVHVVRCSGLIFWLLSQLRVPTCGGMSTDGPQPTQGNSPENRGV